jgi:hypothetical protein
MKTQLQLETLEARDCPSSMTPSITLQNGTVTICAGSGFETIMVYPSDSPNAGSYDNRYFDIYGSNGQLLQRAMSSADDIKNVVFYSRGQNDMFINNSSLRGATPLIVTMFSHGNSYTGGPGQFDVGNGLVTDI